MLFRKLFGYFSSKNIIIKRLGQKRLVFKNLNFIKKKNDNNYNYCNLNDLKMSFEISLFIIILSIWIKKTNFYDFDKL